MVDPDRLAAYLQLDKRLRVFLNSDHEIPTSQTIRDPIAGGFGMESCVHCNHIHMLGCDVLRLQDGKIFCDVDCYLEYIDNA